MAHSEDIEIDAYSINRVDGCQAQRAGHWYGSLQAQKQAVMARDAFGRIVLGSCIWRAVLLMALLGMGGGTIGSLERRSTKADMESGPL